MDTRELDKELTEHCNRLKLKEQAFENLNKILLNEDNEEDFLCGFKKSEITPVFERFEYRVENHQSDSVIITRIGLCVEDQKNLWIDGKELIGYYLLETDFDGEVLDDWFVITAEKYLKDIGIINHFQAMNKLMPLNYLKRNYIQYEYVSYISLAGTLFMSKQFEEAGVFVRRAFTCLERTGNHVYFDEAYLKESLIFLKMLRDYLLENDLVTKGLKGDLEKIKNAND